LIDNGEMKVGEFQKTINVTSTTYSRFMTQHGQFKGVESSVYLAAWAFFKKREMRGIKTTANKKAKKNEGERAKDSVPSVDEVELEGEKEDKVPVFGKLCDHAFLEKMSLMRRGVDRYVRRHPQENQRAPSKARCDPGCIPPRSLGILLQSAQDPQKPPTKHLSQ
jgi:hypothetical protein